MARSLGRCYALRVQERAPGGDRNLRLTVEYSGSRFAGWQVQPDARTVQGELERAVAEITGERARVPGASRTDAGVHALGQVAGLLGAATALPAERLRAGLNAVLPDDVAVREVAEAAPGWHPRFSARGKLYRYRILTGGVRAPTEAATSFHVPAPLDLAAMQAAAGRLVGRHDFRSFASRPDGDGDCTRTMTRVDVRPIEADGRRLLVVEVEGDGFLYKMVRTIVGTLVEVGKGRLAPAALTAVLAARERRRAGPTAPPQGLFLVRVDDDAAAEPASPPAEPGEVLQTRRA